MSLDDTVIFGWLQVDDDIISCYDVRVWRGSQGRPTLYTRNTETLSIKVKNPKWQHKMRGTGMWHISTVSYSLQFSHESVCIAGCWVTGEVYGTSSGKIIKLLDKSYCRTHIGSLNEFSNVPPPSGCHDNGESGNTWLLIAKDGGPVSNTIWRLSRHLQLGLTSFPFTVRVSSLTWVFTASSANVQSFLPLDEAAVSRAVFVIISRSDGRAGRNALGSS